MPARPAKAVKGYEVESTRAFKLIAGIAAVALVVAAVIVLSKKAPRTQLAFPGAEGAGRFAMGGRGGDVYHVTNLNDAGPGSLRRGVETCVGPRTIVFEVSGTIELKSDLRIDGVAGLTIAGQTAPGDGIALKDRTLKIAQSKDIVIRYIRVRLGDKNKEKGEGPDTMWISRTHHIILDHITATWGIDGTMDTEYNRNVTLQWALFGEALHDSLHKKGPHAMLMSFRKVKGDLTLHHNLLFSSRNRHPTLGGSPQTDKNARIDYRNNVNYNWRGPTNLGNGTFSIVGNYYRPGPDTNYGEGELPTDTVRLPFAPKTTRQNSTRGFMGGNVFEGEPEWTRNNYAAVSWGVRGGNYIGDVSLRKFRMDSDPVPETERPFTHAAQKAYELVLAGAGASLRRDAADRRVVEGVRKSTHRQIDSQDEVGGWPVLRSLPPPPDRDRDGMADAWERNLGLDPGDPTDRNGDLDSDGYTKLEEYLNGLCAVSPGR